ncbi:Lantibiotic modifying enzyme [Ruminococcaceae bacterium YRB3002]|nr:Lantibiotic modifying enzyme [Ruminococcaceae bacterium YRB3002]
MILKATEVVCGVLAPSAVSYECDASRESGIELAEKARDDIRRGFILRAYHLMESTLGELFLEHLNYEDVLDDYIADREAESIEPYREKFVEGCRSIGERLPGLEAIVKRTSEQYYGYVDEMLERIAQSYEDICGVLFGGERFDVVKSIVIDAGDVHNNGRSTTIVETDAGKFIYKPHDVRIDLKSYELISTFFGNVMKAPKVCSRDGYGFTEFIVNKPASCDQEARAYFYNLGGIAAFVQMMGSTDLHHSNVMADGVYPVIIDYELIMTPSSRNADKSMAQDIQYSLLYSSLMPARRGEVELSILFARDEENAGSPVVDGVRLCVQDHPDEFLRGFREVYERCVRKRSDIRDFVASMGGISVRHIYRGTRVYRELIKHSMKPGWIGDPGLREHLYSQLKVAMERSGSDSAADITNAEVDAVMRGEIPYICTVTDTCDLVADGHVVYEGFFRGGCVQNTLMRIDNMGSADMAFEEALLKRAMRGVIRRRGNTSCGEDVNIDSSLTLSDGELLAEAENCFRAIASDVIVTPSGGLCWFGPDYRLETGMAPLGNGLIDGVLGLGVFFAAISRLSGDEQVRSEALRLLGLIVERLDRSLDALREVPVIYPNIENVSLSSGLAGKIMGCCLIGRYLGDGCCEPSYLERCRMMVSLIEKMDLRYEKCDVFAGLAGLLKVLCSFDESFEINGVRELCNRLADRIVASAGITYNGGLIWKTLTPPWAMSGAGHGQSGIASALYLAGKRLERDDLCRFAMKGFEFEADVYDPRIGVCGAWPDRRRGEVTTEYINGYCSGAPGIGLNALRLGYPGSSDVVEKAARSAANEPLMYKDFLCCGNSAVVEFLLQAGRVDEARARMAYVIRRSREQGYYNCVNNMCENVFAPSLFYGVAGIGYEMLRLAAPGETWSALV